VAVPYRIRTGFHIIRSVPYSIFYSIRIPKTPGFVKFKIFIAQDFHCQLSVFSMAAKGFFVIG